MSKDIHQEITDKLISIMESSTDNWGLPWYTASTVFGDNPLTLPENAVTKHQYSGINVVSLWLTSTVQGYSSARFATYKQWKKKGLQVRKGEKGTTIVKFSILEKEKEKNGRMEVYTVPLLRKYTVFAAEQVDGTEEEIEHGTLPEDLRHTQAEKYVANCNIETKHGGNQACHIYNQISDKASIQIPLYENFKSWQQYYSVMFHEMVHHTANENGRREWVEKNFEGKARYAFEELVAELGAAFLCAQLGVDPEPRPDHAHYLKNWLKSLKEDKKYIFKAASAATKAVSYLNDLQPGEAT
jgi:antirestriction protein ArdC